MSWRSAKLTWLALRWPRQVEPDQLAAMLRMLASLAGWPVILRAVGTADHVTHFLAVAQGNAALVTEQLRVSLPGLGVETVDPASSKTIELNQAIRLRFSNRRRPLRTDHAEDSSRAVLSALSHVGPKEQLVLQWQLGRRLAPMVVPSQKPGQHSDSWGKSLLMAPWSAPPGVDSEGRSALRSKLGSEAGWQAIGRIGVRAASAGRRRQLLAAVLGALRTVEAPGVSLLATNDKPGRTMAAALPWRWPVTINVNELAVITSWPVGRTNNLPVNTVGSRALPAAKSIPSKGRVIGRSTWPGAERPLALSPDDSLRHLHVLGPTGVGKSTLLLNLIVQDMHQGRGLVVIEPKGDLIHDVLQRVPEHRLPDVVLLDPAEDVDPRPVGLNPLAAAGRSPELVADSLLTVFRQLYLSSWGPRTQDILLACLLTLANLPNATLVALPLLLTDPTFRRRMVSQINDPIALGPFWAGFEAWSVAERTTAIAPVLNKVRPFLMRADLRRVVGQVRPRFEVSQVFSQRKILLVNLSKGRLGPEAARLLGSLVVDRLWQAAQARAAVPVARRHPVFWYFDEFQEYLVLPTDMGDALAAARGWGVSITLAHQLLRQLEPGMRSAVLANARSQVCFQLAHEDARMMAAGQTQLDVEDFQSLGRFEAYASLMADNSVQPWCSLRTEAPTKPTTDPAAVREAVREASRLAYGTPREDIDAELERLIRPGRSVGDGDDLSPRRRRPGDGP